MVRSSTWIGTTTQRQYAKGKWLPRSRCPQRQFTKTAEWLLTGPRAGTPRTLRPVGQHSMRGRRAANEFAAARTERLRLAECRGPGDVCSPLWPADYLLSCLKVTRAAATF